MIKTKKNGFLKAAGIMLAVMMLATCVIAGTLAKYTSKSGDLKATADVAKWEIKAGEDTLADLSTLKFNIYDTNGTGGKVADDEVLEGKVAPGTWGYANVNITNAGDVDAKISATFDKGSAKLPNGMTIAVLETEPENAAAVTGDGTSVTKTLEAASSESDSANVVIAFKWDFGDPVNDLDDTPIGEADADLELGTLKITADQVD